MGVKETRGLNLSVRGKLMGVVLFMTLISAGVGGIAYLGFSKSNHFLDELSGQFIPELALVDDTDYQVAVARRYEKEMFLFSSLSTRDEYTVKKQKGYYDQLVERYQIVGAKIAELQKIESVAAPGSGEQGESALNWGNKAELLQMVDEIDSAFAATTQSLEPMTVKLLAGKSFLEVADEYAVYKKHVHDLEGGVKKLRGEILSHLDEQKVQVADFRSFLNQTLLAGVLAVIFFGIFIGLLVSGRITASISQLLKGIQAAGTGEFAEVRIASRDEFSEIARVFNETMGRLREFIQTDEQRKETERNLINFLEIVSEAAEGDLTGKAPVTVDAFGSIADAYNMMMESLGELMSDTRRKAGEVGEETRRLLEIFRNVERGTESQVNEVQQAKEAVSQTSEAARQIASKATLAQEVSGKVDDATAQGNARVLQNMEGMQLIRVTVQRINKKMKSLSERLLEIGTISELISEVATRTTILAMNASIEASRAGEQGRGFLVISDEIKKLADKSAESTKQIGGIIKAIQTEAAEVTAALEEETRTVEEQTMLAKGTGEAFGQIEQAIQESKGVVTEITQLSLTQTSQAEDVVKFMESVARLSTETRSMILDSAQITEGLNAMSEVLLGSIDRFRLPAGETRQEDDDVIELDDFVEEFSVVSQAGN